MDGMGVQLDEWDQGGRWGGRESRREGRRGGAKGRDQVKWTWSWLVMAAAKVLLALWIPSL